MDVGRRIKDTEPEWAVRRLLHGLGYRYRLHRKDLPGKPDLVFPSRRKAIFVHGCFWHSHGCRYGRPPKSRLEYWLPKLKRNMKRDANKRAELERTFGEHKRRTKVIPHFFTEEAAMKLSFAVALGRRKQMAGVRMDVFAARKVEELRNELLPQGTSEESAA